MSICFHKLSVFISINLCGTLENELIYANGWSFYIQLKHIIFMMINKFNPIADISKNGDCRHWKENMIVWR